MEPPNPLPTLCRAVIYVQRNGYKRAAMVADVSLDRPSVCCLAVFNPNQSYPVPGGARDMTVGSVEYMHDVKHAPADMHVPHSWHYPPRV